MAKNKLEKSKYHTDLSAT